MAAVYEHACDRLLTSAADKERKAMNHFTYFLKGYCVQIDVPVVENGRTIPYEGIPPQTEPREIFRFWDNMMGNFITYMGKHAKSGCHPDGLKLSMNTAESYSSSVKVYYENKYKHEPAIPTFQKTQWGILRKKLTGMFREGNRKAGDPPPKSVTSTSTHQDREAIATACIWAGTPEFAEFWHLSNASYHLCGRGSEICLIRSCGIVPHVMNEMTYSYHVIEAQFQRFKSGPYQTLPVYPHRDGLLEDFYFSMIHLIVVKGCNHEYVLPTFSKMALHTKDTGESDSGVSKEWTKRFNELRAKFDTLADEINEQLGSHSNRRGSNQAMTESSSLSGYAPIFRSGMRSKSIHTIFDYIFGSTELLRQAGKTLSMWVMKLGDTIMGGQPTTFDDIDTDVGKLKKFTDILFEDDVNRRWHPKVRELLVTTLLLRYDQFVDILQTHPFNSLVEEHPDDDPPDDARFTSSKVAENLFLCRVHKALKRAHATDVFTDWIKETKKAFLSRNIVAIPIPTFALYSGEADGKTTLVDPRCFVDHVNALTSIANASHMELQRQRHILNDIRSAFNVESKITSTFIVDKLLGMDKAIQRLEKHILGTPPETEVKPAVDAITFSTLSVGLGQKPSLSEVTVAFFVEDYINGYEREKRLWDREKKDERDKKSIRRKFSIIKKAVRVVLLHAASFPLQPKPPGNYRRHVQTIAEAAEESIRKSLNVDKNRLTVYTLEKLLKDSPLDPNLQLPTNTPSDMVTYFK